MNNNYNYDDENSKQFIIVYEEFSSSTEKKVGSTLSPRLSYKK